MARHRSQSTEFKRQMVQDYIRAWRCLAYFQRDALMELRSALTLRDIRSARERLLAHLVAQAGADGRTVAIKGLLKDLAATIGLTPEVLYRTLAQLEAQRAIQRGDGTITLT